jgi:hypothetical protein
LHRKKHVSQETAFVLDRAVAMAAIQTPSARAVQRRLSQIATTSSHVFANGEETDEEAANRTVSPPAARKDPASCGDLWRLRCAVGDVAGDRQ